MADAGKEGEDDYLSMTFEDTKPNKESSLQRIARLKKEAAERALVPSKAQKAAKDKAAREAALATQIDSSSKGAMMMAKMGFKGGALGQSDDARIQPIELIVKEDKGGIGMDSEKKRKVREAAEAAQGGEKRQKVDLAAFRERHRVEEDERKVEGQMWGAMKVLEGMEVVNGQDHTANETVDALPADGDDETTRAPHVAKEARVKHLRDVNVLYRPLIRQRLEKERSRKMRYDLNNSLSNRNDNDLDADDQQAFDTRADELDDDDPVLEEFEALDFAERLMRIVAELRNKYWYCFWCKYRYQDEGMEGCPGPMEDEHG